MLMLAFLEKSPFLCQDFGHENCKSFITNDFFCLGLNFFFYF